MINKKSTVVFLFLIVSIFLAGCNGNLYSSTFATNSENDKDTAETGNNSETEKKPDGNATSDQGDSGSINKIPRNGAYYVYWDEASGKELLTLKEDLDDLVLFACCYTKDGELFIPENLQNMRNSVKDVFDGKVYISFVNDIVDKNGNEQKSVKLLNTLIGDDNSRKRTIDDIVKTAMDFQADGVEIDFENIKKDLDLWDDYGQFLKELDIVLKKNNMALRSVLGAYTPVNNINLPDGPEYCIMCYNLFGYHSGPGPKADKDFLTEVVERYKGINNIRFILANGGFIWKDETVVKSVTSKEAKILAAENDSVETVDPNSGAYSFSFGDENVVYGDADTIDFWKKCLLDASGKDISVDLWRIE